MIAKLKNLYRGLPERKPYLEFITAFLTIPVLLTVFIANVRSLRTTSADMPVPSPTAAPEITVLPVQIKSQPDSGWSPVAANPTVKTEECIREVGPVEIVSPAEGETVEGDRVDIDISYSQGDYCSAVWSYRISGSSWSEYGDKSISLLGISTGPKTLDLRIKSLASGNIVYLTRNFTVAGSVTPTPEGSPSASLR
ncbi:hypothetical protein A2Z33_06430 [Candidatus Gottesmanbacteria bacterium RBG_16_52_11]|uniref:Uncharacterized protein n=1 Tax=Candidatus Gottesmanbacteria bacterium RBG_16_52_11 TaxID=1798374 RepID=A0A1F5YY64_9BACT|nr:MAG: hypothetical protein A2Z33_06430 [Candidatus Gottesmanbacteria bacterium RBG_16_52_11]